MRSNVTALDPSSSCLVDVPRSLTHGDVKFFGFLSFESNQESIFDLIRGKKHLILVNGSKYLSINILKAAIQRGLHSLRPIAGTTSSPLICRGSNSLFRADCAATNGGKYGGNG